MADLVRTRFAPSPTGYLHIGGARTALFNYLLARRHGGRFVLRIEDTDQTRNIAGAEGKLLEDLRWLGLDWDEGPEVGGPFGPYYQSQRLERYEACARRLLEEGRAYYAFETREELDAMRKAAGGSGKGFRYPRPASFPSEADARRARDEGRPVVVRFKMPGCDFTVPDRILGEVTIGADELDDFVIVKSDGWPTYHFAVVVDDADMRITHVLRGQEHLMNTPNHIALQQALGLPTPIYAHLPIILNMDGSKMSKREKDKVVRGALRGAIDAGRIDEARALDVAGCDAETFAAWRKKKAQLPADALRRLARVLEIELPEIDIHDFRASGYLPEVVVNFIALLGWSAGDDREKYTLAELAAAFSLERIGKTNARFDRDKLLAFNTDGIAGAAPGRILAALRDYFAVHPDSPLAPLDDATLARLVELCAGVRTLRQLEQKCGAMFVDDEALRYDEAAVRKFLLKGEAAGVGVLRNMRDVLAKASNWSSGGLEQVIRGYAREHGLGLGKVAQPIRIAVTGTTVSPSIFETIALLGREKTLARIDRLLARLEPDAGGAQSAATA